MSDATTTPTVGMIYPGHAAEDEYPAAAEALGAKLPVAHIYGTDLHAVPELLDLGSPVRLREGAAALAAHRPQAVMWACTSGSFVYGHDGCEAENRTVRVNWIMGIAVNPSPSQARSGVAAPPAGRRPTSQQQPGYRPPAPASPSSPHWTAWA